MNLPWRNLELNNLLERKLKWRHGINTAIITVVAFSFSRKVCQESVMSHTWECLLEWLYTWSHTLRIVQRQGFQTLPKTSESERWKEKSVWPLWNHSLTWCKPKKSIFGRKKYHHLHSCVGCTADVTGNHLQAARMEAGHHRSQIAVEPELKVFRLKVCKFRSKGCQGQVQDGVSYSWICEEGDVSLEIKRFMFQFRETFTLLASFLKWSKLGGTSALNSGVSVAFLSRSISEKYHFEPNLKYSPDYWWMQKPGKTDWVDHHHGTLSSF